jgi:hypothetical protein
LYLLEDYNYILYKAGSPDWLNSALRKLLEATLALESETAQRDLEIAAIHARHEPNIMAAEMAVAHLSAEIESHYRLQWGRGHDEGNISKSLQLQYGELSMRLPSTPALIPAKGWSWAKIAREVKKVWGPRYFLKPRAPSLNKIKLKAELSAVQLAKLGLTVDATESFSIQLNRLSPADNGAVRPPGSYGALSPADQPRSEAA